MWALAVCGLGVVVWAVCWQHSGLKGFDFLEREAVGAFARLWHRCSRAGPDPISAAGPAILIANHPSQADPAFLIATCKRPPHFLQAQEYYQVPLLRGLFKKSGCIPVGRDGRDVAGLRQALRHLREGALLGIFPEGDLTAVCRRQQWEAKGGAAWLALRSRAPVFPAYIAGSPEGRSVLRAWLWPSAGVRVIYGRPIDLSAYVARPLNRELLRQVTALFMERIEELRPPSPAPPRNKRREARQASAAALLKAGTDGAGSASRSRYPQPLGARATPADPACKRAPS